MACKTPPFSSPCAVSCPPARPAASAAAVTITSKEEFIASFRPTKQSLLFLLLLSSVSYFSVGQLCPLVRPSVCPHQRSFVGSPGSQGATLAVKEGRSRWSGSNNVRRFIGQMTRCKATASNSFGDRRDDNRKLIEPQSWRDIWKTEYIFATNPKAENRDDVDYSSMPPKCLLFTSCAPGHHCCRRR